MKVWPNGIPKGFVKLIGETIAPMSLIIHHGKDNLLEVIDSEKFLIEIMLFYHKVIRSHINASLQNVHSLHWLISGSKILFIMADKGLKNVSKGRKNLLHLFNFFNPNRSISSSKSLKEFLWGLVTKLKLVETCINLCPSSGIIVGNLHLMVEIGKLKL